jgi:hypothetical protein
LAQGIPAAVLDFDFSESGCLLQGKGHIFQSGQRIEQRVALKQKTTPPAELVACSGIVHSEFLSIEPDSPGVRLQDVCETFEENGFSSATRSEDGENVAARNFQIDPFENGFAIKSFLQALDMKSNGVGGGFHGQTKNELMM